MAMDTQYLYAVSVTIGVVIILHTCKLPLLNSTHRRAQLIKLTHIAPDASRSPGNCQLNTSVWENSTCKSIQRIHGRNIRASNVTPPWLAGWGDYSKDKRLFLTVKPFGKRLGNELFSYASLFGIAWRQGGSMKPLWVGNLKVVRENYLTRIPIDVSNLIRTSKQSKILHINELGSGKYTARTENLTALRRNVTLGGYLQSWKYFRHVEDALRQDLTFTDEAIREAKEFLQNATTSSTTPLTRVVVHVRRTDMTFGRRVKDGWPPPRPNYFKDAMAFFNCCFPNVQFIVISDDLEYCRENIKGNNVFYSRPDHSPIVDMAIASLCDHAIITLGSFGWWAAWFANGITITQKNFPAPNATLNKRFNRDEYYLPEWIAL